MVERLADVGKQVVVYVTTGMFEGDEGTGALEPHGQTVRIRRRPRLKTPGTHDLV